MIDTKQLKAVWYLYDDGSREYVDQCQPLVTPRSMLRSFINKIINCQLWHNMRRIK